MISERKLMSFLRTRSFLWLATVSVAIAAGKSHGAGLGPVGVQSALGHPLQATISIIGATGLESNCVKAKVESLDGALSIIPTIAVTQTAQAATLRLSTIENINEPVLTIAVELACEVTVKRVYQVLLDPVGTMPTMQIAALPPVTEGKPSTPASAPQKNREVRRDGRLANVATRAEPAPTKPAASPTLAMRNVLRMSRVDDVLIPFRLKSSNTLTLPAGGLGVPDAAAMAARTEALVDDARKLTFPALQAEIRGLRLANNRLQQKNTADNLATASAQDQLIGWIQLLGLTVLACLIAIAWLAWRFGAIKKGQHQAAWDKHFPEAVRYGDVHEPALFDHASVASTPSESLFRHAAAPAGAPFPANRAQYTPPSKHIKLDPIALNNDVIENPASIAQIDYIDAGLPPDALSTRARTAGSGKDGFYKIDASPKAEEISDVMELVEAWMALREPEKVLELLEPFNDVEQPESPLPWLCLLDVYNTLGDQAKYDVILHRIKTLFNVKLTPWDLRTDSQQSKTLADYPHVVNTILALWPSDDIAPYLDSLLIDNRKGNRDGFDLPVYRDIARLAVLASDPERPRHLDQVHHGKTHAILFTAPAPRAESDSRLALLAKPPRTEPAAPNAVANANEPMSPMTIKLHLAMAYQDIGDIEGACLLIEEIIHDGTPEQIQQAKMMLLAFE